jgi:hypothetical protein
VNSFKAFFSVALVLFVGSVARANIGPEYSDDIRKVCSNPAIPKEASCYEKEYTGETKFQGPYGDNLVQIKIHMKVLKEDGLNNNGGPTLHYQFTIVQINDTNNLFSALSSLTVYTSATPKAFHRPPATNLPKVQSSSTLDRVYGTRVFENTSLGGNFSVILSASYGAEYVESLAQIEVYFPGQSFPLIVPL